MSADHTHEPTQKRIQTAWQEGRFPNSPYLCGAVGLVVAVACLDWSAELVGVELLALLRQLWGHDILRAPPNLYAIGGRVCWQLLPSFLMIWAAMVLVGVVQSGGYWNSGNAIRWRTPDFAWTGFDKLIRLLLLLICFLLSTGCLIWMYALEWINPMRSADGSSVCGQLVIVGYWMSLTLLGWSILDWGYLRWKFYQSLKMSHQELKDELKDQERVQITRPIQSTRRVESD